MSEQANDENTIEIPYEKFQRLRDARSQVVGEQWIDVVRVDNETVRARPVERQEGRNEGELITSDEWLIEDVNGETYTVTEDTFEDKYESLVTERFAIDISFDDVEIESEDDEDVPDMQGRDVVLDVTAHIDLPKHTVTRLTVNRTVTDQYEVEGVPIEIFEDNPNISRIGEEDDDPEALEMFQDDE